MIQLGESNMVEEMSFQALSKSGEYLEEGEKISTTRGKNRMEKSRVPAGKLDLICKIITFFKGV